ncbi:hypothetical protein K458DRAFT_167709 [Lentithecium fluviatile CBS 122367]|uniref:Uncharacterized protein n=1 Tax=Lentithecium fluviatile CBS 122367 TaxID=1168545 RepID=A0A6G1JBP7_9PLEO|nr:hypothetical protein K458DRAFT_167709 [Lentithecium fluviatile CBS 122367]
MRFLAIYHAVSRQAVALFCLSNNRARRLRLPSQSSSSRARCPTPTPVYIGCLTLTTLGFFLAPSISLHLAFNLSHFHSPIAHTSLLNHPVLRTSLIDGRQLRPIRQTWLPTTQLQRTYTRRNGPARHRSTASALTRLRRILQLKLFKLADATRDHASADHSALCGSAAACPLSDEPNGHAPIDELTGLSSVRADFRPRLCFRHELRRHAGCRNGRREERIYRISPVPPGLGGSFAAWIGLSRIRDVLFLSTSNQEDAAIPERPTDAWKCAISRWRSLKCRCRSFWFLGPSSWCLHFSQS